MAYLLQMRQRMAQMEALIQEMRLEIEQLQRTVNSDNQRRLQKMQAYQKTLDQLFGLRELA